MKIFTIGHSVHTKEQYVSMLREADIGCVADVRAFPGSRKYPHFKKEEMEKWLPDARLEYAHFPSLGGRRRVSAEVSEELNDGWDNQSFHNYADYTLTEDFSAGIQELKKKAKETNVACMCSERHPARCHRLLISNWLGANGSEVYHIIDSSGGETEVVLHELGKWGATPIIEEDGTVVYPPLEEN
ncbi:DUF488 family protein [Bacillus piscicola]|uniref:DUF488 domain-containing protein n=1 Tax=Bacillus piscicola TaxID=1632684 RepID=UPI001F08D953|nr:DUF488 domain-containing protein [Bacillus piscicola]